LVVDELNIKDDEDSDSDDDNLDVNLGDIGEEERDLDDDLDDSDEEDLFEPRLSLGDEFYKVWEKRSKQLEHDMAITEWMVSPVKECRECTEQPRRISQGCSRTSDRENIWSRSRGKLLGHGICTEYVLGGV
jgi:hypothetical protein